MMKLGGKVQKILMSVSLNYRHSKLLQN